ncbi:MAG: AMP-binding protein, partial [Bacilli bacterium]|nr:AMP-binding protein [Bacilli bacterium]
MKKENTLYLSLKDSVKAYSKRTALLYMHKKTTYKSLLEKVHRLSQGLISYGIKKDDVVSVCLPNIPSAVHLLYAINQIGAIANLIHPLMKYDQMKTIMEETGSRLLFALDTAFKEFMPLNDIGVRVIACSPVSGLNPLLILGYSLQNWAKLKRIK